MNFRAFCLGSDTLNLRHCINDAKRFANALREHSYEIVTPSPSKSDLLSAFDDFLDTSNPGDTSILYLSGHGLMNRGNFYLALGNEITKQSNLLNISVWLEQFSDSSARNKLVILDCCHALKGVDDLQLSFHDRLVVLAASGRLEQSIELNTEGNFFTNQICRIFDSYRLNSGNNLESNLSVSTLCSSVIDQTNKYNASSTKEIPVPKVVGTHVNFDLIALSHTDAFLSLEANRSARESERIERAYKELLLKNCDIVSLTNLPGQDRELLLRSLELRRLYVPLRVWIDVKATEDARDTNWGDVEARRQANIFYSQASSTKSSSERSAIGPRLSNTRKLVILGDPGSGKTTLIRWLATAYLLRSKNKQAWDDLPDVKTLPDIDLLPIVIRCRELDKAKVTETLDDILDHTLRKSETSPQDIDTLSSILRTRIANGEALLMLDGLDEITDPKRRAQLCAQIEQIHLAHPRTIILITSRIVGYREMGFRLGRGFEHLTLADLAPPEKDDFAKRWCNLTEPPALANTVAKALIEDVHSSDRIERMTGNPMLLTTMALVKRKVGKLPSRRADLYNEAVQVLLNWRSDVGKKIESHEALPQLEYIAHAMCVRGVQRLRRSEMLQLIVQMRREYKDLQVIKKRKPDEFLSLMEANTGLIVEAGREKYLGEEELVYEFRHLTFQEYLAACALVRGHFQEKKMGVTLAQSVAPLAACTAELTFTKDGEKEIAVAENWREALRLISTICHDDDLHGFLEAILNPCAGEKLTSGRARAILATLCVADEPNNLGVEQATKIFKFFSGFIDERDRNMEIRSGIQVAALAIAGTRWSEKLISILISNFMTLPPLTRDYTGDIAGIVIANNLLNDISTVTKWWRSQTTILKSGNEAAAITSALGIASLAMTSRKVEFTTQMIDALVDRLKGSAAMAHAAAQALANLSWVGRNKAWHPSRKHLLVFLKFIERKDSDPEAIRFLVQIAGYEDISKSLEIFRLWLSHPNHELRRVLVGNIACFQTNKAIEEIAALAKDPSPEVRAEALYTLNLFESKKHEGLVRTALNDESALVRATAVGGLSRRNCRNSTDQLIACLGDKDSDVRGGATYALGMIRYKKALAKLEETASDYDSNVRLAAIQAIGQIGGPEARRFILSLLDNKDAEVKSQAIRSLGDIHANKPDEYIEKILVHLIGDAKTKVDAANALSRIGGETAFNTLLDSLSEPDESQRSFLVNALLNTNVTPTKETLFKVLESGNLYEKCSAAEIIGHLKVPHATNQLIDALSGAETNLRVAIFDSLGKIGDKGAEESLIRELDSAGEEKVAIIIALGHLQCTRIVDKLSTWALDDQCDWQIASIEALGHIRTSNSEKVLQKLLRSPEGFLRTCALEALSFSMPDEIRKLLTKNLNGKWPYLDPSEVITLHAARVAALDLKYKIKDIVKKFESIQSQLNLNLAWKPLLD